MRTLLLIFIAVNVLPISADDLTIRNGTVYSDYSIDKVSEKGLSIIHKNGISTIPFEDFPDEIQKKYAEQYYAVKKKNELEKQIENEEKRLRAISCDINPKELTREVRYIKVADYGNGVIAQEYFPEHSEAKATNPFGYTNGISNAYLTRYVKKYPAEYGITVFFSNLKVTKQGKGETLNLSNYNNGIFWRIGAININGNSYACYTVDKDEARNFIRQSSNRKK